MILNATTKSIEVRLLEGITTNQLDITASYATETAGTFVPGNTETVTNGVTAVTVVAAPSASPQVVNVQEITVQNTDTVSHTVVLQVNVSGTKYIFRQVTLGVGATLVYTPSTTNATGGTLTEIDTDFGITGGPITTSGTLRSTGSALNTQSGDYTPVNGDIGKIINLTKTTACTITLNAANLRTGWWAIIEWNGTGTTAANKVLTYSPSAGTFDGQASGVDYPGVRRLIEFDGTNFNSILLHGGFLEVQTADTGFVASKPTGCLRHTFFLLGPGGGGGSGRRGAAGTARVSGSGGGGGGGRTIDIPDSYITTAITFTVPGFQNGGAAISADSTDGNPGAATTGNNTLVIFNGVNQPSAGPGGPGAGGTSAAISGGAGGGNGSGGAGAITNSQGGAPAIAVAVLNATPAGGQIGGANGIIGAVGSAAGLGGASGAGSAAAGTVGMVGAAGQQGGASGGSGGGITTGNVASAGGSGGAGSPITAATGGAAGTSGVAGGNGSAATAGPSTIGHGGGGAGGGAGFDNTAGGTASAAGTGSDGGVGCGGAGGGASLNGQSSGAGGRGGPGLIRWWYS